MKPVIKVENLSKQYRLGTVGTGTFAHDANRWWHTIRGKDDPYQKIGEVNDRATKGTSDYVWALKDINFEVMQGEVLGIIGKNGAGKSTLLKLLSRVTAPTNGLIQARGRIASLLEVGTGFHPELTGRENVFLNGAIMGMTKQEIKAKLDEIVDFSGCDRYIDTPVKRYSSGMHVRLAFAVAAHLEPEILIVDEVLAVGDAEFQNKAIGKMQEVSKGEGRTVLFVSHNMASVKKLCSRAFILENGEISFEGSTESAIGSYLNINKNQTSFPAVIERDLLERSFDGIKDKIGSFLDLERISILDEGGKPETKFNSNEKIFVKLDFLIKFLTPDLRIVLSIDTDDNQGILISQLSDNGGIKNNLRPGEYSATCVIPSNLLATNDYSLSVQILDPKKEHFKYNAVIKFEVKYDDSKYIYASFENTYFRPNFQWQLEKTKEHVEQ